MEFEKTGFEQWHDEIYLELSEVAKKYGFFVNIPSKNKEGDDYANFIINLNDNSMLGLKLTPLLSEKPFEIYPYGKIVGFAEIEDMLKDFSTLKRE